MPRIKLCAIAKDEAAYLHRWIHHHLYFGFDHVEVWLNQLTDNSAEVMERISRDDDRVSYQVVDVEEIFTQSGTKDKRNFQTAAYRLMYAQTEAEGYDYVMFLDLDEFWTPKDFTSPIKDVVEAVPQADSIGFQWYFDYPTHGPGSCRQDFSLLNRICQDRHVKTLLKISPRVERVIIHNHDVSGEQYYLHDGAYFEEPDPATQLRRAKVSPQYFAENSGEINSSFVYHRALRTEREYMASLKRGRPSTRETLPLKDNRWGYRQAPDAQDPVNFRVPVEKLHRYHSSLEAFTTHKELREELVRASMHVWDRYYDVVQLLLEDAVPRAQFQHILRGLTDPYAVEFLRGATADVTAHVDNVSEEENYLVVRGWAFRSDYADGLEFYLTDDDRDTSPHRVDRLKRPDVQEAVDKEAPLKSGFLVAFPMPGEPSSAPMLRIFADGEQRFEKVLELPENSSA